MLENWYYYTGLNPSEQKFYSNIVSAIESGRAMAYGTSIKSKESLARVVRAVEYDHPEFFYINFNRLKFASGLVGFEYFIPYLMRGDERQAAVELMNQKVGEALAEIRKADVSTGLKTVAAIHNYLVSHIIYDKKAAEAPEDNLEAFSIAGVFFKRRAVCSGLAKAFQLLCQKCDIDVMSVPGESLWDDYGIGPHAWNIVRVRGICAHVDVTWDLVMSRACLSVRSDYFCLSDKEITIDHRITGRAPTCDVNDHLEYFRNTGNFVQNEDELKTWLDKRLYGKPGVICFKMDPFAPVSMEELGKLTHQAIARKYWLGAELTHCDNPRQKIVFVRIAPRTIL